MSDLSKRGYRGGVSLLHADAELGFQRLRNSVDESRLYSPSDVDTWDPALGPPETIAEALDRIAALLSTTPWGPP